MRASRLIKAGTYICLFSKFVHEGPSIKDAFYQYQDVGKAGLFTSVDNYCGPIEYGVMINDDLSGDPNCKIVFTCYLSKSMAVMSLKFTLTSILKMEKHLVQRIQSTTKLT